MLDRLESISRLLCIGLGALLFLQLVNAVLHGDPLGRATIPDLPTLPAASSKTNAAPVADSPASARTNKASPADTNSSGKTNSAAVLTPAPSARTNSARATNTADTARTNSATATNTAASAGTNSTPGTNTVASGKTNSVSLARTRGPHLGPSRLMPGKKVDLPPAVQARVDRIVESEILGPFIRPMPMALLGIAGNDAFLRAPDGQSGMVKEGADLGSIKLLRIGINRVLVEENGEKKELMLFAGMGGDSLLPQETNSISNTNASTNAPTTKKETH
jgi:hypothetical protein